MSETKGGGEWTALRELAAKFSDLAVELEKHSNDHIHDAIPDNLQAAVEGVCADRINAILKQYRNLAEALAAAAPAPPPQLTWEVVKACHDKASQRIMLGDFYMNLAFHLNRALAPPQDGQGAELLGPPRGGSSSDLAVPVSPSVGCYVASRASIPARSEMWRSLRSQGFAITSTWIDEAGEGETGDFRELWERIWSEIHRSSHLVLYAEPQDFPLKGALVEVGIALGMGKRVVVVAPTVKLEGRTCRPLGSWIKHPNVSFQETLEAAIAPPSSPAEAVAGNASAPVGELRDPQPSCDASHVETEEGAIGNRMECRPSSVQDIIRRAHEIQEQHHAIGPEPITYPCKVKCKCGAEIEAINRDALTLVFVNHLVMEALAGQPSGVGEPPVPYRAENEGGGCKECHHGDEWTVVYAPPGGGEEIGEGESWDNQSPPEEMAESLNCAFARGWRAALSAPSPTEGASSPADARTELVQKEVGEGLREGDEVLLRAKIYHIRVARTNPRFARDFKLMVKDGDEEHVLFVTAAALAPAPKPAPPRLMLHVYDETSHRYVEAQAFDGERIRNPAGVVSEPGWRWTGMAHHHAANWAGVDINGVDITPEGVKIAVVRRAAERKPPR